ncbi:hypothetical protein C1645_842250 [Glomus cerebriforme]|uniref:Uncharacterized protein n=1 Tax=Glomus cerebriforme TaxID=658196 RepID=A0A397S4C8_9GLOM|nr:hypothetical protein C1645_842250 [Glomus cerebriforme]
MNNNNSSYLYSPNITHIDNPPHLTITPINYNNSRSNIDNLSRSSITSINYNNLRSNINNPSCSSITPSINNSRHPPFNNDVDFHPNNALFNSNNTFRSNNSLYNNTSYALPASFHEMVNIHQICSWLCTNPDVLLLVYNMYILMQIPVANGFNFISSNFNSSMMATGVIQIPKQEDKMKSNQDFLKELKYLFLQVQNSEKSVFEDLVQQIFGCDLNSAEGIDWLRTANRNFSNFHNKFLDNVEEIVNILKEKRLKGNMTCLEESEIIMFIDESLTKDLLQKWLNVTNMSELKAQDSLNTLQRFVHKALIVNYVSRDTDSTKSLDRLIKDIAVPS